MNRSGSVSSFQTKEQKIKNKEVQQACRLSHLFPFLRDPVHKHLVSMSHAWRVTFESTRIIREYVMRCRIAGCALT